MASRIYFKAKIYIIGINPFVLLPMEALAQLFIQAGKSKGPIQIKGTLDGHPFKQNLVKYSDKWRLYLNTPMRKAAGKEVGDFVEVQIAFDPSPRIIPMHPKLQIALKKNKEAMEVYQSLSPSLQKEILRYINALKTEMAINKNIKKAIAFLLGKERFIGRDKPK